MNKAPNSDGKVYARVLPGMLDLAAAFGANSGLIAREASIDLNLLSIPDAVVPIAKYYRLSELIVRYTESPDIGLFLGRIAYLESMHLLLYMASVSRTLRDWLNFMPSISRTFGDLGAVKIEREAGRFALQWHPSAAPGPRRCSQTDGVLCVSALQMDSFCVLPAKPVRVDLTYPQPDNLSQLKAMLGGMLYFKQPVSALHHDWAVLDYPLVHVWTRLYGSVAEEFSRVFSDNASAADSFSLALHASVKRQLPIGECSIEAIAADMNISRRSLQRRLKMRDTNFQQLVQSIKSGLAKKYLADDRLSAIETTLLLGYKDASTFSAAFKSWNNITPTEFRQL